MNDTTRAADPQTRPKADWLLVALLALPLAIALEKVPFATSIFSNFLSLGDLPQELRKVVENVLFVPLGVAVVVLCRLTFGIEVLGLFRPILLAMAFNVVGIPVALAFLFVVLVVVAALRPPLREMHASARIAVLLSVVAALLLVPLMTGKWWDVRWLRELAFFPVIASGFTGESFAKVLGQEGLAEAVWRAATTIVLAVITFAITSHPVTLAFFIRFPEFLLAQVAFILLVIRYFDFRLLERQAPILALFRKDP